VHFNESSVPTGVLPVLCTLDPSILCMYIDGGRLAGTVGGVTIMGTSVLDTDYWHHIFMRYEAECTSSLQEVFCYPPLYCLIQA